MATLIKCIWFKDVKDAVYRNDQAAVGQADVFCKTGQIATGLENFNCRESDA
jgi:hypothetical protein